METVTIQEKTSNSFSLKFEISLMPLTLNQIMGKHWRSRHTNFKTIHKIIQAITHNKKPLKPVQKAKVTIWRYSSGTLDRDNMFFTFKPIVDGLVEAGVIQDDGFDQVKELYPYQIKIKRTEKPRVEVLVEEIL